MMINTDSIVEMTEEYEDIQRLKKERENKILEMADKVIGDNLQAFMELSM